MAERAVVARPAETMSLRMRAEACVELGDLRLAYAPVAWAPLLLTHPDDGRQSRFPRGLVSVRADDGRTGHAWLELNQPPTH